MKKKNKPEDQEQGTGRRNRHSNSFRDQIIRYLHDEKGFSWPKAELGFHKVWQVIAEASGWRRFGLLPERAILPGHTVAGRLVADVFNFKRKRKTGGRSVAAQGRGGWQRLWAYGNGGLSRGGMKPL